MVIASSATLSRIVRLWLVVCCLLGPLGGCGDEPVRRLKIGDPAPPFAIVDLQGTTRSSASWAGFPVILRFWDTECKYCRADTPIINSYFDRFRERGLKVLYVATANETEQSVKAFIEALDIEFPVALDTDGSLAASYEVKMVPQTVIISPDQHVITAFLGGVGEAELEELIGMYLENPKEKP